MEDLFDVLLPVAIKDVENLDLSIKKIQSNLNPRKIIVVANKSVKDRIPEKENIEFCDEDELVANLTLQDIISIVKNITGSDYRSNWYFQQFLKMGYAYKSTTSYYLVWDSDTIPLNKISFFKTENQTTKCLFTMKTEHHIPYFKTINKLFGGNVFKLTNKSFIAEHMCMNRDIMIDMISRIESNEKLAGRYFWEKILYSIDRADISGSGFSEFETYGNYVLKYYPEKYNLRELRTFRQGGAFINKTDINDAVLLWVAKSYDTISFESHPVNKYLIMYKRFLGWIVKIRIMPFKVYQKIPSMVKKIVSSKWV